MNRKQRVVGVDFDNTLVSYDHLLQLEVASLDLLPVSASWSKKKIRDELRLLPDGEDKWQQIQARIYGPLMLEASIIPGVADFFNFCKVQYRISV